MLASGGSLGTLRIALVSLAGFRTMTARRVAVRVFLDFEASSLSEESYPIEVGWIFEDGREESFLIRPAAGWIDWDDEAEEMHGISRSRLERDGVPHDDVCDRLIEVFNGNEVFASAPSWDGHWLSMLLRAAGKPRHLLRLKDTEEAFEEAARLRLGSEADDLAVQSAIAGARVAAENEVSTHRAADDARREWRIFQRLLKR